jgi:hypothetical protein
MGESERLAIAVACDVRSSILLFCSVVMSMAGVSGTLVGAPNSGSLSRLEFLSHLKTKQCAFGPNKWQKMMGRTRIELIEMQ